MHCFLALLKTLRPKTFTLFWATFVVLSEKVLVNFVPHSTQNCTLKTSKTNRLVISCGDPQRLSLSGGEVVGDACTMSQPGAAAGPSAAAGPGAAAGQGVPVIPQLPELLRHITVSLEQIHDHIARSSLAKASHYPPQLGAAASPPAAGDDNPAPPKPAETVLALPGPPQNGTGVVPWPGIVPQFPADLGRLLAETGCGGVVTGGNGKQLVWYSRAPPTADLAYVVKGTLLVNVTEAGFSKELARLCQLSQLREKSKDVVINSQVKDRFSQRWIARCQFAGELKESKGRGIRKRVSKKVGCPARYATKAATVADTGGTGPLAIIRAAAGAGEKAPVAVVSSVEVEHNHELRDTAPAADGSAVLLVANSADALRRADVRQGLLYFSREHPSTDAHGRDRSLAAWRFLNSAIPKLRITEVAARNALCIVDDEDQAHVPVEGEQAGEQDGASAGT